MPTSGSFSGGGSSLGFNMGGATPSICTIPMSGSMSSGAGVSFRWIFSSGFVAIYSQPRGSSISGGFNFPWLSTTLHRGKSLGGNFSPWGGFPFINTSIYRGFFLGTNFGNIFPVGSTSFLGGNPLGSTSTLGSSHAPRYGTIPGGTHSLGKPQQTSSSMNIGGPQGSSRIIETSSPS